MSEKKLPLRSAAPKSAGRRSVGFLSHGGGSDIPRGPDGAPRKARGTRQVEASHEGQAKALDAVPVKPFSMAPKKSAPRPVVKPGPLGSGKGKKS